MWLQPELRPVPWPELDALQAMGPQLRRVMGLVGFSGDLAGSESTYNAGDLGSIPGLGIFQPSLAKGKVNHPPVFWPGEFHGLYSPWGRKLDPTERPSGTVGSDDLRRLGLSNSATIIFFLRFCIICFPQKIRFTG